MNLAEAWWQYATDPGVMRGDSFYTRLHVMSYPDGTTPPPHFHNISRMSFERLSPCRRAEYVPLAKLSEGARNEWLSALKLDRPEEGRDEFFDVLASRLGDMSRDPNLASALLVENMRRFGDEGLRYMEVQTVGPRIIDATGRQLPASEAAQVLRQRLQQADARATGVTVRFLAATVRFQQDAEMQIERAYEQVAGNRDLWVGINMAGREEDPRGPHSRFIEVFRRMRQKYGDIPLSLHAGESERPGAQVRDALLLGARRIGHGVDLISDPSPLFLFRHGPYLVEVSLISKQILAYVPSLRTHPFPEYLRIGVPVCLNTDDRGALDSNLTDEYYSAVTAFDLSWKEVLSLGQNSLDYSFAEPALRQQLRQSFTAAIAAFETKNGAADWSKQLNAVTPTLSGYARRTWNME